MKFHARREFFAKVAALGAYSVKDPLSLLGQNQTAGKMPTRPLGATGHAVALFSLGGEGVLRTRGRMKEAVRVIRAALDAGVNYCDTAPAYEQSQDYYGEALGDDRKKIFLAAKTHSRSRDGSLRLLEDSLTRLKTDHLDLWQLHDLRTREDLDRIFAPGGALEAVEKAKQAKAIRFAGVTGHSDPAILLEAMDRYPFDTVLLPVNAADRHYLSFIDTVVPKAREKNMGVIAMKVFSQGRIFHPAGVRTAGEALSYALSVPVSTALIGCSRPEEVIENERIARDFRELAPEVMKELEKRTAAYAYQATAFKAWPRQSF
jgi:predicted aldo/keto reductase-like oxidoreductase